MEKFVPKDLISGLIGEDRTLWKGTWHSNPRTEKLKMLCIHDKHSIATFTIMPNSSPLICRHKLLFTCCISST